MLPRDRRRLRLAVLVGVTALALLGGLSACSSDDDSQPEPEAATTPTAVPPPPTATPAPRPDANACYRLTYDQALAPTAEGRSVPCRGAHTSETFAVGTVDAVVDGHLLAVDSSRVQEQVAAECPDRLADFLGADREELRLSMLRSVWFTPTLDEAAEGAQWYRCDVLAVTDGDELATLDGRLEGALADEESADEYAMCGTADPESDDFRRVLCREDHSWRALQSVDLIEQLDLSGREPDYPGQGEVREAGQDICADAGEAVAEDALDFQWSYEWPTKRQWQAGQTYGLCWAPA